MKQKPETQSSFYIKDQSDSWFSSQFRSPAWEQLANHIWFQLCDPLNSELHYYFYDHETET